MGRWDLGKGRTEGRGSIPHVVHGFSAALPDAAVQVVVSVLTGGFGAMGAKCVEQVGRTAICYLVATGSVCKLLCAIR